MSKNESQKEKTSEIVKIRISPLAKDTLTEAAAKDYRSFQDQTRLILDQWAVNYINQKEGRIAVVLGPLAK